MLDSLMWGRGLFWHWCARSVEGVRSMRIRSSGGLALLSFLFLLTSCASGPEENDNELQYLSLDRSEVFAPPRRTANEESRELRHTLQVDQRHPGTLSRDAHSACILRLAWLQARQGDFKGSQKLVDTIFRQSPAPRTQALVLAHLLRADLAERQSDRSRALVELTAAERLSRDPRDRNEIDRRRHRLAMSQMTATTSRAAPKVHKPKASVWGKSTGGVTLLSREQWGSRKEVPSRLDKMTRIHRVTIHHTAMQASDSRAANAEQIRAIQRRHIRANGWGDLGYHFMVGRDGTIYEGRRLRYQGAHAGDPASNKGNVGICLLGDYSRGHQKPTQSQLRALQKLTAALCKQYDIPPSGILTHKEVRPGHGTDCPGPYLTVVVQNMRNAWRLQLARRVE